MARNDPLRNFRFRVEIDQITQAFFSEAAIGETTNEPIDYREGIDPTHVRKLPGLTKFGNITLKWGVTIPPSSTSGGGLLDARRAAGKRKRRERRNGEFHGLGPHSASIFPQSRAAGNRDDILNA